MSFDLITGFLVFLFVVLLLWLLTRRPSGLPPGPPLLPFFGNFLSLDPDFRVVARKLRRKYGDIFCVYVFSRPIILLNGHSVLREALVKNADIFSDRPHTILTDQLAEDRGVVNTSGTKWKEQRKFTLSALRNLGFGRTVLEDKVQEEISIFIQALDDEKGQPFDFSQTIQNAVSNIICSLVFGKRFEYTDPLFGRFLKALQEIFTDVQPGSILDMVPVLQYLPGDLFRLKKIITNKYIVENELVKPSIKEHMQENIRDYPVSKSIIKEHIDHPNGNDGNDFITAYIKEIKLRQQRGEIGSFDSNNLVGLIMDLFAAGTETTSSTIRWTIVYFLNYPEVQRRCFQEIKENIGLNKPPSVKDKKSLPYVEATIMEVLRRADIVPTSLPHTASQDVQLRGYTIPKGVMILPMLDSVLQDPDVWGDPENFHPDRFLDDSGKCKKMDELIPFSLGRRVCLGESMARMELFLFLTSMIQKFEFLPADGVKPSMEGIMGLTHFPKPFKMKIVKRE